MTTFTHDTIASQYHLFYSADVFTRVSAYQAEEERMMRECMANREEYDLEGVKAVVAHWGRINPNGRLHRVALSILAEREAELKRPAGIFDNAKAFRREVYMDGKLVAWCAKEFLACRFFQDGFQAPAWGAYPDLPSNSAGLSESAN